MTSSVSIRQSCGSARQAHHLLKRAIEADRDRIAAVPANGKLTDTSRLHALVPSRKPHSDSRRPTCHGGRASSAPRHRPSGDTGPGDGATHGTCGSSREGVGPFWLCAERQPHRGLIPKPPSTSFGGRRPHAATSVRSTPGRPERESWNRCVAPLSSAGTAGSAKRAVCQNDHCFDAVICAYTGLPLCPRWLEPSQRAAVP